MQLFTYKIKCIKDKNHRMILPSNVSSICIQHFQSSMLIKKCYSNNLCILKGLYNYYYLYYVHETVQHNMHIIQGIKKTIKLQNT